MSSSAPPRAAARRGARRRTAAVVAVALVGPLSACGSDVGAGDDTLRITANVTDRASMDAVVAAFGTLEPDVELSVTYAETDQLQKSLPTRLASGDGPDVFTVWPGNGNPASVMRLQADGRLHDLSARRFAVDLPHDAASVVQFKYHTFAVPANYSGIGVIYSKSALAAIGADTPTTWDQLIGLCHRAREKGTTLLALGNKTPWVTQLVSYALAATTVYGTSPDFDQKMRDGDATFAASGWKTAFEKYLTMNDEGCFSDDPLGTTYEDTVADVAENRAVGVVQVASSLSEIQARSPGLELGIFVLPAGNAPSRTRMPAAISAAYGVNAKAEHMKAALAFADFLGSAAGQNAYNRAGATLPAIPNDDFDVRPALAATAEQQRAGKAVPFMDQLWPHPGVQEEHFAQIASLFAGRTTVEAALAALDRAYASDS
ncbi:ABC transporter substrate-binding protein [Streptomyces sp. AM 2-1-1]|uniref:ABC transporter substrate-binding protein n=1 Tax=Streptomyces sp. AM 2-1-1 TaxID=3028709 RepID=UPI0023B8D820|nr:ABC transporter substrate-binding protein [Streptomyces sp. AM 2-1-1]WEH38292.1 ABC transporter substrate-binding protein [Streptomyces sp. AM 2-1-1]